MLMGLWDMYKFAGSGQAFEILDKFTDWFIRFTAPLTCSDMDGMLEIETGGILEVWADIYGESGRPEHLELIGKYTRRPLFDALVKGEDVLSNMHANTTVPEIIGAARAFEVTGESYYEKAVLAYWKCAVTERDAYITGSSDSGEIFCPPGVMAERLGAKNQEHCGVYNMIRLADILFRRTGDAIYADYIERAIHNGLLAQQNPYTGMPAYYQTMQAGAKKVWGTKTEDFWCCHGTVIQAHTVCKSYIYYREADTLCIAQYFPSILEYDGVRITQRIESQTGDTQGCINKNAGSASRPGNEKIIIEIESDDRKVFRLKLRIPWYISGTPVITVNGEKVECDGKPPSFVGITREWHDDTVCITLPKKITMERLPDMPDIAAFMEGPAVLAGLTCKERKLHFNPNKPEDLFRVLDGRHWARWNNRFITVGQEENIEFIPLCDVVDEKYTLYFPIGKECMY